MLHIKGISVQAVVGRFNAFHYPNIMAQCSRPHQDPAKAKETVYAQGEEVMPGPFELNPQVTPYFRPRLRTPPGLQGLMADSAPQEMPDQSLPPLPPSPFGRGMAPQVPQAPRRVPQPSEMADLVPVTPGQWGGNVQSGFDASQETPGRISYQGPQLNTPEALAGLLWNQPNRGGGYDPRRGSALDPLGSISYQKWAQNSQADVDAERALEYGPGGPMAQQQRVQGALTSQHPAVLALTEQTARQGAYPQVATAEGVEAGWEARADADWKSAAIQARQKMMDMPIEELAKAYTDIVSLTDQSLPEVKAAREMYADALKQALRSRGLQVR